MSNIIQVECSGLQRRETASHTCSHPDRTFQHLPFDLTMPICLLDYLHTDSLDNSKALMLRPILACPSEISIRNLSRLAEVSRLLALWVRSAGTCAHNLVSTYRHSTSTNTSNRQHATDTSDNITYTSSFTTNATPTFRNSGVGV